MKSITVLLFALTLSLNASEPQELYKKIFPKLVTITPHDVIDTISANPVNNKILEVFDESKKRIGFVREIVTTTGCDSSCLPIIATLFYNAEGKFMAVLSREGLTRKNHAPFVESDYRNLEFILAQNPKVFGEVKHPTEMVDALSGETLKKYKPYVIFEAAYTSLRLNRYNQDTLKLIEKLMLP